MPKTGKGKRAKVPPPAKLKQILRLLPYFIGIGSIAIALLAQTGYITLPHIDIESHKDIYYNLNT